MNYKNRICFLCNNTKTDFYIKLSELLDKNQTRVSWIVTNYQQYINLKSYFDDSDILYLPLSLSDNNIHFNIKINDLIFADRRLKQIKSEGYRYLRAIQHPIFEFLNCDLPTLVLGELTYGHEVVTYRLTKEILKNCHWVSPFLTRVPAGKFAFFADEAFSRESIPSTHLQYAETMLSEAVDYIQMNIRHIERQSSFHFFIEKIYSFLFQARYDPRDPSWNSNTRIDKLRRNVVHMANRFSYRFVKKVGLDDLESCKGNSVIFPIHLEPELNIDTCGRYWENQFETILKVWRQLGPDDRLYIKEHPVAIGNRGYFWYKRLMQYPNLKIFDHSISINALLNKIDYVFTISGTMGLEAGLQGLKVFCLAPTSYDRLENVVTPSIADFRNTQNLDDLYESLKLNKTISWSVPEYLHHLAQHSFAGDPEGDIIANADSWQLTNLSLVAKGFDFALRHIETLPNGRKL